jgi:hypothetical protein
MQIKSKPENRIDPSSTLSILLCVFPALSIPLNLFILSQFLFYPSLPGYKFYVTVSVFDGDRATIENITY